VLPGAVAAAVIAMMPAAEAHKPITSPFTYSADVLPILRERCGRCHAPGGVAPMSLLTHRDAVPWGESLRLELTAGHMPPWSIDRGATRVRASNTLSARELNVLLTWATGGTPLGDGIGEEEPPPVTPAWAMGTPDTVIDLPAFTLEADEQEHAAEFTIPGTGVERFLHAVDILPGTPAMVRSATVEVAGAAPSGSVRDERLLALWVPGDEPSPLLRGALRIPAGAALRVRLRYRRTWSYEGKAMSDRSRVGLYFAPAPTSPVRAVALSPTRPVTLAEATRAVAVYSNSLLADTAVVVTATRPNGRREELIAFHPRPGWARRFWFREPLTLPRGTVLSVRLVPDPPALATGLIPRRPTPQPATGQVTVNVTVNIVS
jgi:hypothetical protein